MGAGEDNHRGKVPFSSCDIKNISCQLDVIVDTALDHLVLRHPSARPQPFGRHYMQPTQKFPRLSLHLFRGAV